MNNFFSLNWIKINGCQWQLGVLGSLVTLSLLPLQSAESKPQAVYLTWQGDTSSTITVNYLTAEEDARSIVYYDTESRGGDPEKYRFSASGRSHSLSKVANGPKVHWTELKNLSPGKSYFFIAGDPRYGVSAERKFRTVPNDGSAIRFVTGGDMGVSDEVRQIIRQSAAREPHIALIGGDVAYANGNPKNLHLWEDWMSQWTEEMITPKGYTVPVALAIGNHEVSSRYDGKIEDAPFFFGFFAQNSKRSYFRRQFGPNMVVYFLDSGHIASHQSQTTWLKSQMEADRDIPNRFAIYHVPLYPSHRVYNGQKSELGRLHWEPLFSHYELTAAFENHDHTFKRTKKLMNGEVAPDGQGVLYLGDGCWGRNPRAIPIQKRWYLDKTISVMHFWQVDVSSQKTQYRAVTRRGLDFDVYPMESKDYATSEAYFQTLTQQYLVQPEALIISPLLSENKRFKKDSFTVTLTNKELYPLEGRISMSVPDGLRIKPSTRTVNLSPGDSDTLKFTLSSSAAADVLSIPPVQMELFLDYRDEERTISQKVVREIKVDRLFSARRLARAPNIDGNLEEWTNLPYEFIRPTAFAPLKMADFWEGSDDASLKFAVAYDQKAVYLAIKTTDDQVQTRLDYTADRQDSLYLWFDIFPGGEGDDNPLFAVAPGNTPEESRLFVLEDINGDIRATSVITETGYNTEIAFPMDAFRPALEDRGGGKMEYVRLNIAIMDKDHSGQRPLRIFWRPRWEDPGDYIWSGVFKLD